MLRYTSLIPAYKRMAKVFSLSCVSTLQKMVSGKLGVKKSSERKWKHFYLSHSNFEEIYLQKCEEYFGGETFGVDERGEIFKGMISFMLVGLKINTHFIINCVTERDVNGYFVLNNLEECLHELDFNVRINMHLNAC